MNANLAAKPISVCFVIDRLSRAGTEMQLLALIAKLDRRIVRPTLCLLNGTVDVSKALAPSDCEVLTLGLEKLGRPKALLAARRLALFWRRNRVEIVQTYFLDSTYFAAPLARLCGIRHVIRVQNNVGYWLTARHRRLQQIMGKLSLTLTNSEEARRFLLDSERIPPDRVAVIENGVDLERFSSISLPFENSREVRVGVLANLRPVKNVDGLIRAAAILRHRFPAMVFHIAGDGPERAAIEQQAISLGFSGQIRLLGAINDVPGFLSEIDIAVLSSHSESMSNALLEYMAAGRAVVATDVGANSQLVRHGREGLIVPAGDDRALADAIGDLAADPNLAKQMAQAARLRVEERFSRDSMIQRFTALYQSLMCSDSRSFKAA